MMKCMRTYSNQRIFELYSNTYQLTAFNNFLLLTLGFYSLQNENQDTNSLNALLMLLNKYNDNLKIKQWSIKSNDLLVSSCCLSEASNIFKSTMIVIACC